MCLLCSSALLLLQAMCQLLLSSGANPLVRDSMNHTALYYAVKAANDDVITLLRQYKAS